MTSPLDNSLRRLDKLASKLNEATENLNERLSEIEERFRQTKLGLEVWLEEDDDLIPADPLHAPDGTRDEEQRISLPPDSEAYHRAFESYFTIGWAKLGDSWRLGCRRSDPLDQFKPEDERWKISPAQPLGNAPRHVRIAALSMISRIADVLASEAARCVELIEKATGDLGDLERSTKGEDSAAPDDDVPY